MDLQLTDRLSLVSGSTAGIGFAIAETLAREGARVIVNGRKQEAVDAAVASIKASTGRDALGFAGDLSKAEQAEALVKRYPGVEILVNNLGIFEPKPFEEIPDADWLRFFDVNVLSGVRLARLYLPAMRRANWGRIIFISSESGVQIPAEMIHYGMTKTAQLAVSRGARGHQHHREQHPARAHEVARRGRFRRSTRPVARHVRRSPGKGVLRARASDVFDQAVRLHAGSGFHGGLHR